MSLQAKFAVLVFVILTAVAGSLWAAVWSFKLLETESGRPAAAAAALKRLDAAGRVLDKLNAPAQPSADELHEPAASGDQPSITEPPEIAPSPETPANKPANFAEIARELGDAALGLDPDGSLSERIGLGTANNLRQRLTQAAALAQKTALSRTPENLAGTQASFRVARDLLSKVQGRVLDEVDKSATHADKIRTQLVGVLGFTLGSTILVGLLGLILMRRWVVVPVARLRVATAAVARGDFTHRISASGSGELVDLSHEVDHMAGMVSRMQDERVERERLAATGEMVRRLAHNLRNPLSGIRGLAEVSIADLPQGSELRDNQSRIVAAVDRFERWLADLLNVTSPLRINPQQTNVRAWLSGLLTTQSPMARSRHIALVVDDAGAPDTAIFDPRHLEHAVVALVTNAIQATPERGTVRVTLGRRGGGEDGTWSIRVEDTGPGIPESLREKVFTPYFTTKKDGSGIGLPLARQIARSHGGDLRLIEPAPGSECGGAIIDVELPIQGPPPPAPLPASGGSPNSAPPPTTQNPTTSGLTEDRRAQNPRARGRRESASVNLADAGKGRS